eukprot:Transcript_25323.p2 GENE.Transcript_25323~~Transcript_25323.p2  ORF type:complete len:281 (+),score=136.75 Transcript_25323:796-1638(+)
MEMLTPRSDKDVEAAAEPRGGGGGGVRGLPFDFAPARGGAGGGLDPIGGAEVARRGERPMALRAGWVLGATAMAVSGSVNRAKDGGAAAARASARRGTRRGAALRRVLGGMSLLLAFSWTLGIILALGAALLDKPVAALLDEALETALRLRRGLLRRPHLPPGSAAEAVPPLLRAALLLPLRMPTVFFCALLLNMLCVRATVPATVDEVRRGFEIGFRQLRSANSAATSAQQEAVLQLVSRLLRSAVSVMHAARATALGIGALVLLGSCFEGAAAAAPAA